MVYSYICNTQDSAPHNGVLINRESRNFHTSRYSPLVFSRGGCQFDVTLRFTQGGRTFSQ